MLRTCQRLRDGRAPAEGLAFSAVRQGRLVGTLRLWHVSAGGVPALVLGPLAVDPACRELGVGAALMDHALAAAEARGHGAVILLGDAPYYARFGFSAHKTGELSLPGPFERDRLLGLELREGALDGACGMIVPTGRASDAGIKSAGKHVDPRNRARPTRRCAAGAARRPERPDVIISRRASRQCGAAAPSRGRSTVTTILLILLAVMIVRDIFVRRWGPATPPSPDVTQRSP